MENSLPVGQVTITIMLTLQARLGPVMDGQDSSHVNGKMELNMDTELDKKKELNERLVQSLWLSVSKAFFAPVVQSLFVRSLWEKGISKGAAMLPDVNHPVGWDKGVEVIAHGVMVGIAKEPDVVKGVGVIAHRVMVGIAKEPDLDMSEKDMVEIEHNGLLADDKYEKISQCPDTANYGMDLSKVKHVTNYGMDFPMFLLLMIIIWFWMMMRRPMMMSTEDVQPNGGGESGIYEVGEVGGHGCKMKTKEYVPMTSLVMLMQTNMIYVNGKYEKVDGVAKPNDDKVVVPCGEDNGPTGDGMCSKDEEDYPKASNVDNEVEIDVDNEVGFAEMDVDDEVGFGHDAEANDRPGHKVHVHMFEETEMKGVSHPAEYDMDMMDMIYDQEEDGPEYDMDKIDGQWKKMNKHISTNSKKLKYGPP